MKRKILEIGLALSLVFLGMTSLASTVNSLESTLTIDSTTTDTFTVYGNCGMCERTIEGALKDVKGIVKGDWNRETKIMTVSFVESEISLLEIKKRIAKVGYDTDEIKAEDRTYNGLPGCCKYERPK